MEVSSNPLFHFRDSSINLSEQFCFTTQCCFFHPDMRKIKTTTWLENNMGEAQFTFKYPHLDLRNMSLCQEDCTLEAHSYWSHNIWCHTVNRDM